MTTENSKIKGVFLQEKVSKIGTGRTEKMVTQKMYCIAKESDSGEIEVRYLDGQDQPLNMVEKIPKEAFIKNFTFQPYYFETKEKEKQKKLNKHIAIAEEHAKKNELYSAEYEFKNALKVEEENLRANFGIGNVYLKMGEKEKAKDIFVKISQIDAIFEEENKHFFNECGIQLRKQELYDEAIDYYKQGIQISPNDENLYFNLARAHFEKKGVEQAREAIYKVLAMNPKHKEAKAFLQYMDKKAEKQNA